MQINIEHIVASEDLGLNVQLIKKKLKEQSKIVIFENNTPQFIILPLSSDDEQVKTGEYEQVKIGEYVQAVMKELFSQNRIHKEEIQNLLSYKYSKTMFKMSFPILKEVDAIKPLSEQKRDSKGYNRYYNFTLSANGKQYLLCSQWLDRHYDDFEKWYHSIGREHV